jgi:hypothetical protein
MALLAAYSFPWQAFHIPGISNSSNMLVSSLYLWLYCHSFVLCQELLAGTHILPHIAWPPRPSFEIWMEASMTTLIFAFCMPAKPASHE